MKDDGIERPRIIGDFQLNATVSGYEAKTVGKDDIIFYNIDLYSNLTDKEWNLKRRFNDFHELYLILSKYFFNLPSFPSKSLGKVTNIVELNKRKELLDNFLKEISRRSDLLSNSYTIKFLALENHFPDFQLFQPLLIYSLEDLSFPITDFHYDKRTSLLFVGLSNTTITGKLNNYFSKIFSGSTSKNAENIPGFLFIYNIIKNNSGAHHFELLYEKALNSEVSCINFYPAQNMLCVGLNNGSIVVNKIFVNESSKVSKELVEEVCVIKAHKKKIVGVSINFTIGYVYSVANEGTMNISELNYQSIMKSIPVSKKAITGFFYDEKWGRVFLTDDNGSIWIIDIQTNPLQPRVLQALHNQIPQISTISVDLDKNLIFIGNNHGIVVMYLLENYNEKIIPQYQNMSNINVKKKLEIKTGPHLKVTSIKFTSKNEIIISFSNGGVAIYSHEATYPEFVIDAHTKEITGAYWDEDKKMLLTLSQDKSIKLFQFPIFWPSEMLRKSKYKNKISLIKGEYDIDSTERTSSVFCPSRLSNEGDQTEHSELMESDIQKIYPVLKNLDDLTEKEINCEDLDGWDN